MISDGRILGGSEFIKAVLKEADKRAAETLRLRDKRIGFKDLCEGVAKTHRIEIAELISGSRRKANARAREDVAQLAVKKLRLSGAEIACHLGVTTSCINRVIAKKETSLVGKEKLKHSLHHRPLFSPDTK